MERGARHGESVRRRTGSWGAWSEIRGRRSAGAETRIVERESL